MSRPGPHGEAMTKPQDRETRDGSMGRREENLQSATKTENPK